MFDFDHHHELVRAYRDEQRRNHGYELLGRLIVFVTIIFAFSIALRTISEKLPDQVKLPFNKK